MIENRLDKRIKVSNKVLLRIAKIDELKGRWSGSLALNPRILGQLKRSVIITSAGSSTRIEGSKMSDKEVDRFLRGLNQNAPKGGDEEEVAGYADILGRIFDHYDTLKITESGILHLHDLMLKFSKKTNCTEASIRQKIIPWRLWKKERLKKDFFNPTPSWLVKKKWTTLFLADRKSGKKDIHPLLSFQILFLNFLLYTHLKMEMVVFLALTNLMLLQQGYAFVPYVSLEEIIESRQSEYYISLRQTQKNHKTDNENIETWLLFFLDCVLTQTKQALKLLEGNDPIKLLSEIQKQVYDKFISDGELSVSEIQRATHISLGTVKQALSRLLERNLIERLGQGRATRYKKLDWKSIPQV